jgi:crotonobetainyl-CoA:carnitine CoA-transferase CaiB-like acyl-CoA transferase
MSTQPPQRTGPLAGIRVLDLSSVVLGPLATQILGDYGADVIKVEGLEGDLTRAIGVSRNRGTASLYLAINRNKRSLAIDLKSPDGVAALRALLPTIDVLVHNMRIAAIDRLGLGYDAVAAVNPGIVYCAATGFGQDGPDAGQPAFDDVIQAACGLASLIGHERGDAAYVPSLIADKTVGVVLANAVMAALFHRARGGGGQYVEVPMLETMAAFTMTEHMGGLAFDPPAGEVGYARILSGGRRPARTLDGFVALLPYTAAHWRAFFEHAGRPDLAAKYGDADRHERNAQVREMYAAMFEIVARMSTEACLALCRRLDLPATRIYGIGELQEHPHLKAVGLFQKTLHPTEGPMVSIRPTTRFAATPAELALPAPDLGQHTEAVLREAGLDDAAIATLAARGVIRCGPDAA